MPLEYQTVEKLQKDTKEEERGEGRERGGGERFMYIIVPFQDRSPSSVIPTLVSLKNAGIAPV